MFSTSDVVSVVPILNYWSSHLGPRGRRWLPWSAVKSNIAPLASGHRYSVNSVCQVHSCLVVDVATDAADSTSKGSKGLMNYVGAWSLLGELRVL